MQKIFLLLFSIFCVAGCIGNDYVLDEIDESVRITNPLDELAVGDSYQFSAVFINNIGQEAEAEILWSSSDTSLLSVDAGGLATGLEKGDVTILAEVLLDGKTVTDQRTLSITDTTIISAPEIRTGVLQTTSSYQLEGSFTMREENGQIILAFEEDYAASTALPGLYLYLTNNPATSQGAYEIGAVQVFSGAHTYTLPVSVVDLYEYSHVLYFCKPFNVKVGDGVLED